MSQTWPVDWPERVKGRDCPMCAQGRPEANRFGARVFAGDFSDAYLQRADVQHGYTIVIWRDRHVAEPTELSEREAAGYWREVLRVARAIEQHYGPAKMNFQMLANAVPHLHTHLTPRYLDDPAPGRPLPFPETERPPILSEIFEGDVAALRRLLGHAPSAEPSPAGRAT